jgi:hypothetical protein
MKRQSWWWIVGLICLAATDGASARITRLVIDQRATPGFEGAQYGAVGAYELLSGHVDGELDPKDPLNAIITDIALAPRNAHGMVEYSATFALAKPVDMTKASGVLLYQVPNRGNPMFFAPDAAGDVILMSGWQGDIVPKPGRQTIKVPVAHNPDGSAVTGRALAVFVNMAPGATSLPIMGGLDQSPRPEPADLDTAKAQLTKRAHGGDRIAIAAGDWAFADCRDAPFPGKPDPRSICLRNGFDPANLYELSYIAKDPLVLGIGFAATRDINAFFRFAAEDDAGTANPVAGQIKAAIAIGFSQSGNYIRSFIHLGFNQAETKQRVWDGAESNIAGRQIALNIRVAAPGGAAGIDEPGSEGVLWWSDHDDSARHNGTAGLLDRCRASDTCPKIFDLFGSSEFWGLRMSPDLVGPDAKADIPLPPEVRRYYSPGVTHGGGRGGFSTTPGKPPLSVDGPCVLPENPNPSSDTTRALTKALIDWVVTGIEPPPSRYPRLKREQLVPPSAKEMGFPALPGVPVPDGKLNPLIAYDFGTDFNARDLSGVMTTLPPVAEQVLPSLVPRVDADGNERSGVPSVLMMVPLGTYLGWNEIRSGYFKGDGCGFAGGYIPFAATMSQRLQDHDPRLSLEERYQGHADYVVRVRAAAARLVSQRFLLQPDADRIIAEAEASSVLQPQR